MADSPNHLDIILNADASGLNAGLQSGADKAQVTGEAMEHGLSDPLEEVGKKAEDAHEKLDDVGNVEKLEHAKEAIGELKDKLSEFGKEIESAAAEVASLQRSLSAGFIDPAKLEAVTGAVREMGVKFAGVFSTGAIGNAAKDLQKFGQYSTETMERIANASAGAGVGIEEVASSYGRFLQGDQRAGLMLQHQLNIKADDLAKFGAVLDSNGKLMMATADQAKAAGDALGKVIDARWADAASKMADPVKQLSAAMEELEANLGASTEKLKESAASAILPFVESLQKAPPALQNFVGGAAVAVEHLGGMATSALQTGAQIGQLSMALPLLSAGLANVAAVANRVMLATAAITGPMVAIAAAIAVVAGASVYLYGENQKLIDSQNAQAKATADGQELWEKQAALYAMTGEQMKASGKSAQDFKEAIQGLNSEIDRKQGAGQDASADVAKRKELIQALTELNDVQKETAASAVDLGAAMEEAEHQYKLHVGTLDALIFAQRAQLDNLRSLAAASTDDAKRVEFAKQANELEEKIFTEGQDAKQKALQESLKAQEQIETAAAEQHLARLKENQAAKRDALNANNEAAVNAAQVKVKADEAAIAQTNALHQNAHDLELQLSQDVVAQATAANSQKLALIQAEVDKVQEAANQATETARRKVDAAQTAYSQIAALDGEHSENAKKAAEVLTAAQNLLALAGIKASNDVADADRKAGADRTKAQQDLTAATIAESEKRKLKQIQDAQEAAAAEREALKTVADAEKTLVDAAVKGLDAKRAAGTATADDNKAVQDLIIAQDEATRNANLAALQKQIDDAAALGEKGAATVAALKEKEVSEFAKANQQEIDDLQKAGVATQDVVQQLTQQMLSALKPMLAGMGLSDADQKSILDSFNVMATGLGSVKKMADETSKSVKGIGDAAKEASSPLISLKQMADSMSLGDISGGFNMSNTLQDQNGPQTGANPNYYTAGR